MSGTCSRPPTSPATTPSRVLDTAEQMAATQQREIKKLPTLRGRTVVNLFFEDSTRTRISFEAAAKRLSADVINFSAKGSSVSKGESLKDTALTLEAMGADAVVVRHPPPARRTGSPTPAGSAARWSTPATAPTSTPRRRCSTRSRCGGTSAGGRRADLDRPPGRDRRRRPAQPGGPLERAAAAHARAPRSSSSRPPTLLPVGVGTWPCRVSYDLDAVLRGDLGDLDAVMMLRVQRERMTARVLPERARVLAALRPRRPPAGDAARRTRSSCTRAR